VTPELRAVYWRARDLRQGVENFVQSIWFGNDLSLAKPFRKVASRTARQKGKRDSSVHQGIGNRKRTMIPMQVDVEEGSVEQVLRSPNHPYTRGLLACVPRVDARVRPLPTLPGNPHGVWTITAGCRFAPRCADATAICTSTEPRRVEVEDGHNSACWVFAASQGA